MTLPNEVCIILPSMSVTSTHGGISADLAVRAEVPFFFPFLFEETDAFSLVGIVVDVSMEEAGFHSIASCTVLLSSVHEEMV